ncbi:unnamed protein product [Calicophoron daubneyi]|uniref:L-serine deaminase n=3 Tax=Calicophoron daubneyi TaxID=300641 RepID=A0AAV2T889_CALDB
MTETILNGSALDEVIDVPTAAPGSRTKPEKKLITDVPIPPPDDPDIFDPACDPDHPVRVGYQEVLDAQKRIEGGIIRTQCKKSSLSKAFGMNVYLKLDFQQVTGSFKERGARNLLLQLSEEQRRTGIIASSAGNHALAIAYHGGKLGIPVTVVMPKTAPLVKVENCKNLGAEVLLVGEDMGEAKPYALKLAKINNLLYVNGFDHPQIIAGQGTVGIEILEQVPNVDAIVVSVGGGGLIAGVAAVVKALKPTVQVIGAETNRCAAFAASFAAKKLVYTKCEPTIADGLSVPIVGCNSLCTSLGLVDKMVSVDEAYVHRAIVQLLEVEKFVVEGAGATGLAAIMAGLLPELKGKTVVPILSGGNIDTTVLSHVIERGLAFEGRLCTFTVVVSDRPGAIAKLCDLLGKLGVSIKDIFHERAFLVSSVYSCQIRCVAETKGHDHAKLLKQTLEREYSDVSWGSY